MFSSSSFRVGGNADFVVFISPTGSNTSSCGLSVATACQTIAYANDLKWEVGATATKTFQLGLGTYTETKGIIIERKLRIIGQSQTECIHTRTGNIDPFTLNTDGADLVLSDLTLLLIGTYNYIRSAGINVVISVSLINCRVRAAAQFGGPVIYFNNTLGSLSFSNCKMYNMNMSIEAFVHATKMKGLLVSDCSFTNMYRATNIGSVFHIEITESFTLRHSLVVQCFCARCGGVAQLFMAGPAIIDSCMFWNTSALADHSGVAYLTSSVVHNASMTVVNSSFVLCTAISNGGVLYFEFFVSPNCTRCAFTNCSASTGPRNYGGALVHLQHGGMFVVRCMFRNCCSGRGGALFAEVTDSLVVSDSIFVENTATANGRDINYRNVTSVLIIRSFTDFAGVSDSAVFCNTSSSTVACTGAALGMLVEGTVCANDLLVDDLKPACPQPCVLAPSTVPTSSFSPCTPLCPSTHVLVNNTCVPVCALWKAERNIGPQNIDLYDCVLPCVHDTSLGAHLCAVEGATVDDFVPNIPHGGGRHILIYLSPEGENITTCGLSAASTCLTIAYAYSAERNVGTNTDTKNFQLLPGTYTEKTGINIKGTLNIVGQHQADCVHTRTGNFDPFTLNTAGAELALTNLTLLLIGGYNYIRTTDGNVAVSIRMTACRIRAVGEIYGKMVGVDNTLALLIFSSCTVHSINATSMALVHGPRLGALSISDSSFAGLRNSNGGAYGSVICLESVGSVTIVRSLFVSCFANRLGGVCYLILVQGTETGTGTGTAISGGVFSGCVFWNCTTSPNREAGAVWVESTVVFNATVLLSNCSFVRCSGGTAGAVFVFNNVYMALTRCAFTDCTATTNGGALVHHVAAGGWGTLRVTRCVFSNGVAQKGGAIYCENILWLTVVDVLFVGNTGTHGKDMYYRNSTIFELTRAYTDATPSTSSGLYCNATNAVCKEEATLLELILSSDICASNVDNNNNGFSEDNLNPSCPQPCVLSASSSTCEPVCAAGTTLVHGACVPRCSLWKADLGESQGVIRTVCDAPCTPDTTLGIDLCASTCVSGYEPSSATNFFSLVGGHCTLPSCERRKPVLPSAFILGVGIGGGGSRSIGTGTDNRHISSFSSSSETTYSFTSATAVPSTSSFVSIDAHGSTSLISTVLSSSAASSSSSSSLSLSALRDAVSSSLSLTPLLHSSRRSSSPTFSPFLPFTLPRAASASASTSASTSTSLSPPLPLSFPPRLLSSFLPNTAESEPCGSNADCFYVNGSSGGGSGDSDSNGLCTVTCPSFYTANRTTGLCTLIACMSRTPDNPAAVAWPCGSDNCLFDVSSETCVLTCPAGSQVNTSWCTVRHCHPSHYTTLNGYCVLKQCEARVVNASVVPYACGTKDCFFSTVEPPTTIALENQEEGGAGHVGIRCHTGCAVDNLHSGSVVAGTSECALKECESRTANKSVTPSPCGELTCLYDERQGAKQCSLTCSEQSYNTGNVPYRDFGAGKCEELTCARIGNEDECKNTSECHYRPVMHVCEEGKAYSTRLAITIVVSVISSIVGIFLICCISCFCYVSCGDCCSCEICGVCCYACCRGFSRECDVCCSDCSRDCNACCSDCSRDCNACSNSCETCCTDCGICLTGGCSCQTCCNDCCSDCSRDCNTYSNACETCWHDCFSFCRSTCASRSTTSTSRSASSNASISINANMSTNATTTSGTSLVALPTPTPPPPTTTTTLSYSPPSSSPSPQSPPPVRALSPPARSSYSVVALPKRGKSSASSVTPYSPVDETEPIPMEAMSSSRKLVAIHPIDIKDDPEPTDKRYGPYLLMDCIGEGAQGVVYKARHEQSGIIRALKIVTVTKRENAPDAEVHIGTEFGKLCKYLVDYEEVTIRNGKYFILMEYCPGGDLRKELNTRAEERRPFENKEIVQLLFEIGTAVKTLHDRNVVHRDIKPENIFSGAVFKLGDYGTAKFILNRTTTMSSMAGTLEYLPPEAFRGEEKYGKDVDIYAFGIVLLEMMALRHPFKPKGGLDVVAVSMGKYDLSPNVLRYNAKLISLALEMISMDPSARPLISTILSVDFLNTYTC